MYKMNCISIQCCQILRSYGVNISIARKEIYSGYLNSHHSNILTIFSIYYGKNYSVQHTFRGFHFKVFCMPNSVLVLVLVQMISFQSKWLKELKLRWLILIVSWISLLFLNLLYDLFQISLDIIF